MIHRPTFVRIVPIIIRQTHSSRDRLRVVTYFMMERGEVILTHKRGTHAACEVAATAAVVHS